MVIGRSRRDTAGPGAQVIGYAPEDNSAVRFIDAIAAHVAAADGK
jgi:hypothetical protein